MRRWEEAGGNDLYPSLYPPGWCLLPHLEDTHRFDLARISLILILLHSRRLWRDVSQFNKLDRVGQVNRADLNDVDDDDDNYEEFEDDLFSIWSSC